VRRRLAVAAALVILVLPVAAGAWAFAGWESARARSHAEALLQKSLQKASSDYQRVLAGAGQQARLLASSHAVQRAFERHSQRQLDRNSQPHVQFVLGPSPPRASDGVPSQSIRIIVAGRRIGTVTVRVPFDHQLLTRLAHASRLPRHDQLAFANPRSLLLLSGLQTLPPTGLPLDRPADVLVGGKRYLAISTLLTREASAPRLVALAPTSEILAGPPRRPVLLAGLVALTAVALAAYSLAPLLGRNRLARQQREQAARVLSHLGDGVFLVDSNGVIILWNAAAETITGLAAQQICGASAETALPGWRSLAARIPTCQPDERSRPETIPLVLQGRELWLSIAGVEFNDGTVYAFRDATSEHRLEAIRAEFVATVSHELRTPLAALHGAALTLTQRREQLPAEMREKLLDMIAAQSKRLASLVEDILLAGQLDAGSLHVQQEPFDATTVARAAVAEARQRATAGTMLHVSTSDNLPHVLGDEARTHQILANLIDNAIKYSPTGTRVDVEVQREHGHIRFTVRDQGPGIPRAEQEHVFEKFYRLDPDHHHGVGGSGLGLYICRQLVSSMHGRIWVDSAPERGSTFAFDLPVADERLTRDPGIGDRLTAAGAVTPRAS
jgi:two-component system phosphate regulon sensor histidine kinase PhoR